MKQGELLYEGKAKQLFVTEDPSVLRVKYKDMATAYNGEKKEILIGKGELNNRISAKFFQFLHEKGIENHFIQVISPNEQLVKKVTMIPLEVVVRNRAAGSISKRLGIDEGTQFEQPILEIYYKDDALGDPLINEDHVSVLKLATSAQMKAIKKIAYQVNEHLSEYLAKHQIILVDFKLEFGLDESGRVLLADEISPDTCRFWDAETNNRLDKDRFRRDLGHVVEAYQEIWKRIGG